MKRCWIALSRRGFLMLASGGISHASTSEFWNKKPLSQWTPVEIQQLLNDSPWAKHVTARYRAGDEPTLSAESHRTRTWTESPPLPLPQQRPWPRAGSTTSAKTTASGYTGTVRWESARPILDAVNVSLPGALSDDYVISVSGIPVLFPPGPQAADQLDSLRPLATLLANGRAISPAMIDQKPTATAELLFGFSKDRLKLTKRSGELRFSAWLGRLLVETTFDPKRMLYLGALAL